MKLIALSSGQRQSSQDKACVRRRGREGAEKRSTCSGEERNRICLLILLLELVHGLDVVVVGFSTEKISGPVFGIVETFDPGWAFGICFSACPTGRRSKEAEGGPDDGKNVKNGSGSQSQLPAMKFALTLPSNYL